MTRAKATICFFSFLAITVAAREAGARHLHRSKTVTAKAAILIDNQTGVVLWERNPDLPLPPASTTKIVTAMLALQSGRLDDSFTVTPEAAEAQPSKISLKPGWRMRLRDLVYAVLLNSANDASVVIAEGLAGSVHNFAERMNALAQRLGATNTHFVNPNGLPAADHYTTVRDLATMFSRAMQNPLFEKIVSTKVAAVSPTAGSSRRIALRNHNRLLGNYRIRVIGKTGWTIAAKKCFVGAADADGREVVVAVLGSRDLWGDVKRLVEYGLDGGTAPAAEPGEAEAVAQTNAAAAGDDDEDGAAVPPSKYAVRLATFRNLGNARHFKKTVARKGYAARIVRVHRGRHTRFRVSVGPYANRRQAQHAARTLKRAHPSLDPIIVARN